jgi:hypothetical protein
VTMIRIPNVLTRSTPVSWKPLPDRADTTCHRLAKPVPYGSRRVCSISAGCPHPPRRLSGPAFECMRECAHLMKAVVNFRDGNETTAYYTDHLEDAINTAVEMVKQSLARLIMIIKHGLRLAETRTVALTVGLRASAAFLSALMTVPDNATALFLDVEISAAA